jgi:hypothetical protein
VHGCFNRRHFVVVEHITIVDKWDGEGGGDEGEVVTERRVPGPVRDVPCVHLCV